MPYSLVWLLGCNQEPKYEGLYDTSGTHIDLRRGLVRGVCLLNSPDLCVRDTGGCELASRSWAPVGEQVYKQSSTNCGTSPAHIPAARPCQVRRAVIQLCASALSWSYQYRKPFCHIISIAACFQYTEALPNNAGPRSAKQHALHSGASCRSESRLAAIPHFFSAVRGQMPGISTSLEACSTGHDKVLHVLQSAPPESLQGMLQRAARLKMLQVRKQPSLKKLFLIVCHSIC